MKRVVQTFENESYELVHVFVNGEEIITTPSHPFYVPKLGWTSAIKLRAGDILVLSNGEYVVVEAVQHEILESPVKVYNFEVEDFHTYFVGESSVLVHNKCSGSYDIEFQSGKHYVGKGNEARMRTSARRVSRRYNDPVVNMDWRWAKSDEVGFIDEYMRMSKYGFDFYHPKTNPNSILYNKIMTPGAKIFGRWFQ